MKQTDWLERKNAEALARKIQTYWKVRGFNYTVTAEPMTLEIVTPTGRSLSRTSTYVVRSDIKFRCRPNLKGPNIDE
jgi:hypothetical protein